MLAVRNSSSEPVVTMAPTVRGTAALSHRVPALA